MPEPGRRDSLVLDTGPLFTYLLLHFLNGTGASKARRNALLQEDRSNDSAPFAEIEQDRFRQLLKSRRVLTTTHVVTEAFRLRGYSLLKQVQTQFRNFGLELFTSGAVEEVSCSLREMCTQSGLEDLICRFGPADASVTYLGIKAMCLVLTDDTEMFQTCQAGAPVEIPLLRGYLDAAP